MKLVPILKILEHYEEKLRMLQADFNAKLEALDKVIDQKDEMKAKQGHWRAQAELQLSIPRNFRPQEKPEGILRIY